MSLSRRSLLTRLAALLASVPLLRLRGEAKAATPVPSRPLPPPFDAERYAAWFKAQANDERPGPFPMADTYGEDEIAAFRIPEGYGYWRYDPLTDTVTSERPTTPPRDGGWM